jgi:hypothetical protein
MKPITLTILFSAILLTGMAQVTPPMHPVNQPAFYMDSIKVAYRYIFDPYNITNVNVVKGYDSATKVNGKVYFTTKNPGKTRFLPLDSIAVQNGIPASAPVLYILDHELVKDAGSIRIDPEYILKTVVVAATEIDNLKDNLPAFVVLKILTRTKANIEDQQKFYIRGTTADAR